ncbi:ABC transporter ATP-binding protein [Sphaerospermopsis torques-reginae]|uniref:ABC transporter ATP-binding protein/permease n=1 Tax=Sphaerospermopsis torques-reginae ITEP-024 TaxID=984208 RepID=A0ABX8X5V3_9CYAN|nr:ABC transporter ATP-binding protein [Sphaerospermopsis torques-reginae]QYX33918.1 ABC transporter ATP-binding protein/permease [Sphaerospermopsis torques-reginae ITEP-024]
MATGIKSYKASRRRRHSVHPLQRLFDYGHKYQRQIWLATGASVLNKVFDLAPPALIGIAVDVVVKQQDSIIAGLGIKNISGQFAILSFLTVVTWILESFFEYRYKLLWRNLGQNIQHNLRLDAYKHLQELELAYFEERSTGGLMSILNDDVNQLERFLDVGANDIIQVITTIVIISSTFFILAPGVAWMAILPMPFILAGSIAFQKLLAPRYANVREKVGLLNGRLSNNLSGITTIKSFTSEDYEAARIESESNAYRVSNAQAIAFSAAYIPIIRMFILAAFTILLIFGGMQVIAGNLAVGAYSSLVFLVQLLLWPLTRLGDTFDLYQRAMASTNRVMDLLDTTIEIHTGNINLPVELVRGAVEFKNVTFAYKDRPPVIKNLSLEIPAGNTIAVVGSTGSGKSTLVKLLLRFYEAQHGKITLDGVNLQSLNLRDLRRCIGLVSQDVFLFHGTVAENIAYGTFDASQDDIIMAAKVAEADDFIMRLPQGYETIVGERGQKLSGGQKQRIAIARAVLKNPPILILDEATSAVDNETEAAIQRSLERITVNRTTIAIAHRLSTIRNADCIYVMEHGQLVESGTHQQLLEKDGVYTNLWRVQSGLR